MIVEVQCFRTDHGIQLVFHNDEHLADVFEFSSQADIDYVMSLIRIQVPAETLLVEARDRAQTTVH